jgi:NAD(P)H dehydrogenase (quinone)
VYELGGDEAFTLAELAAAISAAAGGMSRGELFTTSGDLRRLIGRPATSLAEAIDAALR